VIVEPMQGTAGNIVPPREFLPAMKSIADDAGALFIADEMITGLGRTGTWWGVDHTGVAPDIVTIGKAVGGGFPLSALATTDAIAAAKPWSNASGSSSSYGGNPLAAAAGAASLRIIEDEGLVENSRRIGELMLRELEPWVDRYPFVGTVRGSGMFLAIELVSDKVKKTPLPRKITERIFSECVRRGLLTMSYSASFRIQPPLTTDEATARNGLAILREVFDLVDREAWWKP
jgi:4-aminobutyrate aminotransferase/(S)-3-amino-2-methylpropionate transaminase